MTTEASTYPETRRQYCLAAMGVDVYVPRIVLANAKATVLVPDADSINAVDNVANDYLPKSQPAATSQVETGETVTSVSPMRNLVIDVEPERRKVLKKNNSQQLDQVNALQFHLRVWVVANNVLVIDSRDGDIALPTDALMRNMMSALGYTADYIGKSEILRWPISKASIKSFDPQQNENDARSMVQAFIEAQQQRHGFKTLFVMGDTAAKFALNKNCERNLWDKMELQLDNVKSEYQAIVLPSLCELLQQPQLKRNTWLAIKHLQRQP